MFRYLLLFVVPLSLMAVLEIKPIEIAKNPGFSANAALSIETKRGNTDKDIYTGDLKVQYDNNHSNVMYMQLNSAYARANGIENINNRTFHIRDLHKLKYDVLVAEFFIQSQQNKFKSINERDLIGGDIRLEYNSHFGKLYFAFGMYRERLFYLDAKIDNDEYNNRINSYIAYNIDIKDDASFTYLGYAQPKVDNIQDYYLSQELELNFSIYKKLSLLFKLAYNYDSSPAHLREKEEFSQLTAFSFKY